MKNLLCKRSLLSILAVAACAAGALGMMRAEFTWTGVSAAAGNAAFNLHCNWHSGPLCMDPPIYPDDTGDNATFPAQLAGTWAVDLVTEEIGDLTIEGTVDFGAAVATPTLDVQKLVIVGGSASDTIITIGESAKITITNP